MVHQHGGVRAARNPAIGRRKAKGWCVACVRAKLGKRVEPRKATMVPREAQIALVKTGGEPLGMK